ncbi:hypothetical protein ACFPZ0_11610 [Streptomonospora nanhaiensis]|uniref:Uncharacterized protein n=1 Tax=Streptomonospora nanhaiensis TaxID=1323731 RepID=A0A853BLU9_9ACTN|nr:hypothetical protein [Streptomonospora nanhaiensis]MBV2366074.1 hypothetical protein [Streptomonospora nanhaiensis]MBX9388892.1 hypothetical protein [Streptomonospora nanhaiensis]NYI96549.1 hypothetical protein [Streptomonospora nanhaiensis]
MDQILANFPIVLGSASLLTAIAAVGLRWAGRARGRLLVARAERYELSVKQSPEVLRVAQDKALVAAYESAQTFGREELKSRGQQLAQVEKVAEERRRFSQRQFENLSDLKMAAGNLRQTLNDRPRRRGLLGGVRARLTGEAARRHTPGRAPARTGRAR